MTNEVCESLINESMKSRHCSKWIKGEIKQMRSSDLTAVSDRWKLCNLYSVVTSLPLSSTNEIYGLCEKCEFGNMFLKGDGLNGKQDKTNRYSRYKRAIKRD